MENVYSVEFFMSFIESLQGLCQQYLNYSQFVEVSGYVCVEIDNMKKERYVLSELLQSSGNVISESYCTKSFKTNENDLIIQLPCPQLRTKDIKLQRSNENSCSNQRSMLSSQSVFPRRSNSHSMMLPVHPVLQDHSPKENVSNNRPNNKIQPRLTHQDFNVGQFNIQKPVSGKIESCSENIKEDISSHTLQSSSCGSRLKRRKLSFCIDSTPLQSPASASNLSYSSESEVGADPIQKPRSESSSEIQVTLPQTVSDYEEQRDAGASTSSSVEASEVIDLDFFEDEFEMFQSDSSFQEQSLADVTFDVSKFINQSQKKAANPGSLNVLKSVLKRFKKYHFEKSGQDVDPLNTLPEQLNEMLLDFLSGAKKMDGSDLTVGSLKNTQVYMERYLKQGGYPYSITRDDRFKPCRDYIKARQEEEGSRDKQIPKHLPVIDEDIEVMFQKNVLGSHSPDSLFNTLWLLNTKHFAKKKPGEHLAMKWGDIQLSVNEAGEEYLERPINEAFSLKVFANPDDPDRCFVNFYKQYRDMRPKGTMNIDFAFYLKQNKYLDIKNTGMGSWFLPEPMMYSPFTYVWKKMVMQSGISINKKLM